MSVDPKTLSRSALVLAARRAVETQAPMPLVDDPYARILTTDEFIEFAERERDATHYVLLRHRVLDDFATQHGHTHAVLLGAGLDTKSLRYPGMGIIEVDDVEMVQYKKGRLEEAGLSPPNAIAKRIASVTDLLAVMQQVPPGCNSVVVAEGFFMYHSAEWLSEALGAIAGACVPAPNLGFDLLAPEYFTHTNNQGVTQRLRNAGEVAQFGETADSVRGQLESLGYDVEVWTPSRLAKHYLKTEWRGRNDKYVVTATRTAGMTPVDA